MLQHATPGHARAKKARRAHRAGGPSTTKRPLSDTLRARDSLLEAEPWEDYDYTIDEHEAIEEARTHGDTDDGYPE